MSTATNRDPEALVFILLGIIGTTIGVLQIYDLLTTQYLLMLIGFVGFAALGFLIGTSYGVEFRRA
ncbi:hypothetical protein ACFQE1_00405 [Halobium palmae]|uniref:Major facilitator superfamily (MFS) profile domain-containing protein n=1 Tax=Halobium palmae TaxID=1776492 RepID=A0ABD5RVK6_9EURY